MNFKRVIMTLLAVLLLPGFAYAQTVTRATFAVSKIWDESHSGNPAAVTVSLNCNTGLPLTQSQSITATSGVNFVVESFTDGTLDCTVSEADVPGYSSSSGCVYDNVNTGTAWECAITNTPDPVEVYVTKDWVIDGSGGDQLDPSYEINLYCYAGEILGGSYYDYGYYSYWQKELYDGSYNGTEDTTYTAHVIPDWDGDTWCYADEYVYDSSIEVDQAECNYGFYVEIGDADLADGCTITNTVFYEGIPTLSQYGMAIMALLMLGVGFVGFRRFV